MTDQSSGSGDETDSLVADTEIGPYRILRLIGRGGMGQVYLAEHTRLERQVALKTLPVDRVPDQSALDRFHQEMRAVGRLDHPNIVRATDAGEADGIHFLAMDFVAGLDVSVVSAQTGSLAIADACEIVRQSANGLHHAFEHRLVHRDIKPSNLMLSPDGRVRILDLGLARLSAGFESADGLTATGMIMGTLDYMAPEQADNSHEVDIRADIYSLGATLYRLLTGIAPFGDKSFDSPIRKLSALANQTPVPVVERRPDIPAELADLIGSMMAHDPEQRPVSPHEVATHLALFAKGHNLGALCLDAAASAGIDLEASTTDPTLITGSASDTQKPRSAARPGGAAAQSKLADADQPETGTEESATVENSSRSRRTRVAVVGVAASAALLVFLCLVSQPAPDAVDQTPKASPKRLAGPPAQATVAITPISDGPPGLVRTFIGHGEAIQGCDFSPDGRHVASASIDKTVRVWDTLSGRQVHLLEGHTSNANAVRFLPDGDRLLSSASAPDCAIRLWDLTSGKSDRTMVGHTETVAALALSSDGSRILSSGFDRTILWDAGTGLPIREFEQHHGISLALSRKLKFTALAGSETGLWSVENGEVLRIFNTESYAPYGVAISPDDSEVACACSDHVIRIFKVGEQSAPRVLTGHTNTVLAVQYFPDGRHLISSSNDDTVRIWDATSGEQIHLLKTGRAGKLRLSPDGRFALLCAPMFWTGPPENQQASSVLSLWRLPALGVKPVDIGIRTRAEALLAVGAKLQVLAEGSVLAVVNSAELPDVIEDVQCADLSGQTSLTTTDLEYLAEIPGLFRVDLRETEISDEVLLKLAGLPIRMISLDSSQISDRGFEVLTKLPELEGLTLEGGELTATGLKHLAAANNLKSLALISTKLDESAVELLAKMTSLRSVRLFDTGLSESGSRKLTASCPHISVSAKRPNED